VNFNPGMTVEAPSNGGSEAGSAPPARTTMQTWGWMPLYVVLLTPPALWVTLWASAYLEHLLQPRHWILVQHMSVVLDVSLANFVTMWPLFFLRKRPNHPLPTLQWIGGYLILPMVLVTIICSLMIPTIGSQIS